MFHLFFCKCFILVSEKHVYESLFAPLITVNLSSKLDRHVD